MYMKGQDVPMANRIDERESAAQGGSHARRDRVRLLANRHRYRDWIACRVCIQKQWNTPGHCAIWFKGRK